jgi:hypothetical protein
MSVLVFLAMIPGPPTGHVVAVPCHCRPQNVHCRNSTTKRFNNHNNSNNSSISSSLWNKGIYGSGRREGTTLMNRPRHHQEWSAPTTIENNPEIRQ